MPSLAGLVITAWLLQGDTYWQVPLQKQMSAAGHSMVSGCELVAIVFVSLLQHVFLHFGLL